MSYFLKRPRAFWISICNLLGLTCSVAGVLLLFYNVLPTPIAGAGTSLMGDDFDRSTWEAEFRRHDRDARIGLVLVLVGTLLEAVPPFCTAIVSWRRRPSVPQMQTREETEPQPNNAAGLRRTRCPRRHSQISIQRGSALRPSASFMISCVMRYSVSLRH